jgi:N-acetyl-anhydromuramyl-L-alanine amidase AmpD
MKKLLASSILIATLSATSAQAQPVDSFGGPSGAQTIHHCGYLSPSRATFGLSNYTTTPLTARLVQQKLQKLGYYGSGLDGRFGSASQSAVRAFQLDYSLPVTGQVDGTTATRIAFAAHPSTNVKRCYRQASNSFR